MQITAPVGQGPNDGNLCVKGRYGFQFINHPDRLTQPLVRKDGELVPATWGEALGLMAERFAQTKAEHGAKAMRISAPGLGSWNSFSTRSLSARIASASCT